MGYNKEWLTPDEIETMLNKPDIKERHEMWIRLLYVPALRVSEAIGIRYRDLNFDSTCVDIWGGKGRAPNDRNKAPCNISTLTRLKRFCEHSNLRPNDYIMYSQYKPQVTRQGVWLAMRDVCRSAGIDKIIGTHTFRRSRAEHLLDAGLPITYVSKYLRHRDLSTTMKYLDISITDIQRELEKISDPMDGMS